MINYTFGCDANILDNSNAPLGKWFSLPDFIKSTSVPRVVSKSGSKFFKFQARIVLVISQASGREARKDGKKVLAVNISCNFLFYNKLVIVIKHLRMGGKRHTTAKSRVDTRKLKRQPFCEAPCSLELIKYENGDFSPAIGCLCCWCPSAKSDENILRTNEAKNATMFYAINPLRTRMAGNGWILVIPPTPLQRFILFSFWAPRIIFLITTRHKSSTPQNTLASTRIFNRMLLHASRKLRFTAPARKPISQYMSATKWNPR